MPGRRLVTLVAAIASCARPASVPEKREPVLTVPAPERVRHADSDAPLTRADTTCRIRGKRQVDWFDLYASDTDPDPVAWIGKPDELEVVWSGFSKQIAPRARLEFERERLMRFSGWAKFGDEWFSLARRVDVLPGVAWSWRGAAVRPEAEHKDGLVISVPTPFREPERLETIVECAALSFDPVAAEMPASPSSRDRMERVSNTLEFHAEPGGPVLLRATYDSSSFVHDVLERRGGFWHLRELGRAVVIDGWVPESALQKPGKLGGSHRVKAPRVRRGPYRDTASTAEVVVSGPIGTRRSSGQIVEFASIEAGAQVYVVKREGDRVAIRFVSGLVQPVTDSAFWISSNLLGPEKSKP